MIKYSLTALVLTSLWASPDLHAKSVSEVYSAEEKLLILGDDKDQDGVRDDIKAAIDATYSSKPLVASALIQMAKSIQSSLVVDTQEQREQLDPQSLAATKCLFDMSAKSFVNPVEPLLFLESLVTNTPERAFAYARSDALVKGRVSQVPDGNTCDFPTN